MRMRSVVIGLTSIALAWGLQASAVAHEGEKHKNLKVLKDSGKDLEKGMKALTKGLGVKCDACHVKGKFDSDDNASKAEARKFLTAAVGEKDATKRGDALKALLSAMKLKEAKDEAGIWSGVDLLQKTAAPPP